MGPELHCAECGAEIKSFDRRLTVEEWSMHDFGSHGEKVTTMAGVFCSRPCVASSLAHLHPLAGEDGDR